jgi:hypothetical protein
MTTGTGAKHYQKMSILVSIELLNSSPFKQQAEEHTGKKLPGHPGASLPCVLQTDQEEHQNQKLKGEKVWIRQSHCIKYQSLAKKACEKMLDNSISES